MPTRVTISDDGEIEDGWDISMNRINFTIVGTFLAPMLAGIPLGRLIRNRLTEFQEGLVTLILVPPIFLGSVLLSWRIGGLFWPNRPLTDNEIAEWRERYPDET